MTVKEEEGYVGRKFVTEFRRTDFDRGCEAVGDMVSSAGVLREYGLTPGTAGNISVRREKGMYIKAGGRPLGALTPEDIVLVVDYCAGENRAVVCGLNEPSSETPMHWLIYAGVPGAGAIVHVHDYVVLRNLDLAERLGVRLTSREEAYGTLGLAEEVLHSLRFSDYVLMRNHGSLAVGRSIEEATKLTLDIHKRVLEG